MDDAVLACLELDIFWYILNQRKASMTTATITITITVDGYTVCCYCEMDNPYSQADGSRPAGA